MYNTWEKSKKYYKGFTVVSLNEVNSIQCSKLDIEGRRICFTTLYLFLISILKEVSKVYLIGNY